MLRIALFVAMLLRLSLVSGDDMSLVGTWSSKSNSVFTGPDFYDPVDELLIEPALPGLSYSFTEDGHFEEATYQITPNPQNHSCPVAALIYQHGTYEELKNGTLILTPFEVDGRQLLSEPCSDNGVSTYSRYHQIEKFRSYALSVDSYHGRYKLQLYESDGSAMQPLYLAYRPPLMLPTQTLNPTSASEATAESVSNKVKRSLENRFRTNAVKNPGFDYDFWWWLSVGMMGVGSALYFFC
ncbi:unnamed protein product [Kuraishia capsulata CBS 1993]|uniref:Protein ROT1 n=1 Tax=Kuraishia capsulata CBS 1993 TaxID=1382522 RepID=W6MXW9_9ASCO|nr:uncharacterized protein KUCA_T00005608001 [Kuraishia capsulata CBS 1993]CDK29615.1 unnamed protein product [Kuraishia capsulata CBS 1993]